MKRLLIALAIVGIAASVQAKRIPEYDTIGTAASGDYLLLSDTSASGREYKVALSALLSAIGAQGADADLTTWSGVTPSANGQSLVSAANYAAMRTLLDLESGTDFNPYDADIADLADGSLTGTKVGFADTDGLWTAANVQAALEELNDSINSGAPNGTGAKVHWSQLLGVPAGFADGADAEGSGSFTYPGAGIPNSTGSAWGTSYTLDTDLSSVSASDDTIPSAKATKAALDAKVAGPASATDNTIVLFNSTTGKLIKGSVCTISSTGIFSCTVADGSRYASLPDNTTGHEPAAATVVNGFYSYINKLYMVENSTKMGQVLTSGNLDDTPADNDTANAPTSNALVDGLAGKQNADGDLDDLADGTLGETKIDAAIARDTEVKVKYLSGTEVDFYGTLLDPQAIYAVDGTNHAVTIANNVPAAFTITEISVSCDANPTTEITLTFQHKAAGIGYGTPTTIEAVQTTDGAATITTGFDDATIPAGTKLFMTLSDPDDALNECSWQIEGDWD